MAIKTTLLSVGGSVAILGLFSGSALAGGPAHCGANGCDVPVSFVPSPTGFSDAMTVESRTPYDYLDSVHFQRSPHVSILRVHGLQSSVKLGDTPAGFTQGCHPESTTYCRAGHGQSAPAPRMMPQRVVATGGGYSTSNFTPRVYGDPHTITPGIAYLPTTIVDRNPYRAQAVLDAGPGGVTPALTGMPIGPLPMTSPQMSGAQMMRPQAPMMQQPVWQRPMMMQPSMMQRPIMQAPMMQVPMMQAPMMRAPAPMAHSGAARYGRYGSAGNSCNQTYHYSTPPAYCR